MDIDESEINMPSDDEDDDDDDLSGDESSESDGESDDDEDEDDDDYESGEEIVEEAPDDSSMNATGSKSCSSDDDPERESCPVCLNKFKGQELGTPESCEHTFCFDCIQEWSKNINTCPIDRTEFNNIYLRVNPGGTVLRKVKVKVLPKEPEDALTDSVTLCEICHRGDREDRLLLCDGCDLAYHCECLDPPLYYIPIEEWHCPPCSGVLNNRHVAGPSRTRTTTRRAIPRTRASEAVRSRVQNLRGGTSRSSSISRKTNASGTPKKRRKRRVYRKAIKKVVTLARTKKDMSGGKGKLGTRGSTVIITYRRRKRRKGKRKVSKRSAASNRAISLPSSKVRIANRLGISKPLQGSTMPQVKQSTGSRSRSSALMDKMPKHSLFGNKDQLMDFSENFTEDVKNESAPSTSARNLSAASSSSSINILDSILAGQKILHAKPDNVLIKTDGSLILKEGGSNVKKHESVRKLGENHSARMPMSVALAKQGVRTSIGDKSFSSWKKHSDISKTKNISEKVLKSNSDSSNLKNKLPENNKYSANYTKYKSQTDSSSNSNRVSDKSNLIKNLNDKGRPSSLNIKRDNKLADTESYKSAIVKSRSESDKLRASILSEIARDNLSYGSSSTDFPSTSSSYSKTFKIPKRKESLNEEACKNDVTKSIGIVKTKQEVLSPEENDCDFASLNTGKIRIKQEVLSDDETKDDCLDEKDNVQNNVILSNIKKEPIDATQRLNSTVFDAQVSRDSNKNIDQRSNSSENNSSDLDASQSIIDSLSCDASVSSNTRNFNTFTFIKVKEEIPSDSEEFSQSLLLANDTENSDAYTCSKSSVILNKVPIEESSNNIKERDNATSKLSGTRKSGCLSNSLSNKEDKSDDLLNNENESEDDNLPCTQALFNEPNISDDDDDDDELPPTQAVFKVPISNNFHKVGDDDDDKDEDDDDDTDDDIPCAQAPAPDVSDSDNDLTSAQDAVISSDDDDDDKLPPTQLPALDTTYDEDDDLPCTQAVFFETTKEKTVLKSSISGASRTKVVDETSPPSECTQFERCKNIACVEDECPPTQANCDFLIPAPVLNDTSHINSYQDELPPTQATPFSVPHKNVLNVIDQFKSSNSKELTNSSFDIDHANECTLSPTQIVSNTCNKKSTYLQSKTNNHGLFDLSATQKSDSISKSTNEFDLPDTQIFELQSEKFPNIEATKSADKTLDLPATQISDHVSNVTTKESNQTEIEVDKLSLNHILSNIKQLVNSLSVKDSENYDFQRKSQDIFKVNLPQNCVSDNSSASNFADKLAEQSDAQNETMESMQSEDSKSMSSDDSRETIGKNKKIQENTDHSSDSESEDLTPDKVKEILKKSSTSVTPKKSGVHKHLPQVIPTIPVKEHLKIKPSCKRTFSFEEVAKLEGPIIQQKIPSKSSLKTLVNKKTLENIESSSNNSDDFFPATQKVNVDYSNTESSNEDSLPATQIQPISIETNCSDTLKGTKNVTFSTGIQKSKGPSANERETENFPANGFFPENFPANGFFPENFDSHFDISNANSSSFDHPDSDDLPPTQLFRNTCIEKVSKNKENNSKRKPSVDAPTSKKRASEQNINDSLKANDKKLSNRSENLSDFEEKLKTVKSSKKQTLYETLLKDKHNSLSVDYEKDLSSKIIDSLSPSNKTDNQNISTCHPVKVKQEKIDFEFVKPLTTVPLLKSEKAVSCRNLKVIKIKTEDPDDLPPTQVVNFNCLDNDDSLPPTQVTNFEVDTRTNKGKCDSTVYENILSASEIKKEPCDDDDDEVTVIDPPTMVKVKEEIVLSDDDDINENVFKINPQNPVVHAIQERKVTSTEKIDISSIKKEKHNEINSVSLACTSESKTRKVSNEELQKKTKENSAIQREPKNSSDHSKAELEKSHKHIEQGKGKMDDKGSCSSKVKSAGSEVFSKKCNTDLKESYSFKGEKAKNSKVLKEKRRISEDSSKSVEKNSKHFDNSHSTKDSNQDISKGFHKSVEPVKEKSKDNLNLKKESNKISKELHSSKELKRKMSENSAESHIISKESHSSKKKSRKMSEDFHESHTKEPHASKERIRKMSEESITSKESRRNSDGSCPSNRKGSKSSKDYDASGRKFLENTSKYQKKSSLEDFPSRSKEKEHETKNSKSCSKSSSSSTKHIKLSKESSHKEKEKKNCDSMNLKSHDSKEQNKVVSDKSLNSRHLTDIDLFSVSEVPLKEREINLSAKERRYSEKENDSVSKSKNEDSAISVTLKPMKKRTSEHSVNPKDSKKKRLDHSSMPESYYGDDILIQLSDVHTSAFNTTSFNMNLSCDMAEANKTVNGKDIDNAANMKPEKEQVKSLTDCPKIFSKQELKDEIANEVKLVLKPFYSTSLISKEDYKDIMRRAVPKIYINCHNCINPEKIRKLVLNYVSLINKS